MKKVRLYENERLDIPDALGLQDMVFSYVARFFGAILGDCEGLSEPLKIDFQGWQSSKTIELVGDAYILKTFPGEWAYENDAASGFLDANPAYPKADAAYCFHFNDTLSPKEVNLTSFYNATIGANNTEDGPNYSIWARRIRVGTDVESRRFWDETTGGETTQNVETRTKSSIEWTCDKTNSSTLPLAGWIRVFDCVGFQTTNTDASETAVNVEYSSWVQPWAYNDYAVNATGAEMAPVFRPVIFWDYQRQHYWDSSKGSGVTGGGVKTINPGGFPAFTGKGESTTTDGVVTTTTSLNSPTREYTGEYVYSAWNHPTQRILGSLNEKTIAEDASVILPNSTSGSAALHPKMIDTLTAIEASMSDNAANVANPGLLSLLQNVIQQLGEIKFGPTNANRGTSGNNQGISPWTFSSVGTTLPPYDKRVSTGLKSSDDHTKVNTALALNKSDIEGSDGYQKVRADLNSVRPLSHLNQLYNNWGRAHPQVLLSGMLCTRVEAPDFVGDSEKIRCNFKWYGPLYNPLGFRLIQHNSSQASAQTWKMFSHVGTETPATGPARNVSNAYAVYPRLPPAVDRDYTQQTVMATVGFEGNATGIPHSELGADSEAWGTSTYQAGLSGFNPLLNLGKLNGGYDLLIRPPEGINDDELHIFSVNCTETSSWGPNNENNKQWPYSPMGIHPAENGMDPYANAFSSVANENILWANQKHSVSPGVFNIRAHVGPGVNLYNELNFTSQNNIFIACAPPPRLINGALASVDGQHVQYSWFFVTVFGVAPNHLTADRVFRGQRSHSSTDRAMLDSSWQVKWAKPYIGSQITGAGYTHSGNISLYGPDAAALSLANQRTGWHTDTKYSADGTGAKGGAGGFWSYADAVNSNT